MAFILFTDFLKLISPGQFGVYSHFGGYLVGAYYYYSLYGFPKFTKRKKSPSKRYSNENKQINIKQKDKTNEVVKILNNSEIKKIRNDTITPTRIPISGNLYIRNFILLVFILLTR